MMDLKIDRSLQNNVFGNWRLGHEFVLERSSIPLPGLVSVADASASVDYVRTRSSVLHNHVVQSQGRCFLFIQPHGAIGVISLYHVLHAPGANPPVLLHKLSDLPVPQPPPGQPSVQAPLECTLAVLSGADPGADANSVAQSSTHQTFTIAVSLGFGDLQVLHVQAGSTASATTPVYPIRPEPPLAGVLPFKVEAAYTPPLQPGQVRCVLSTMHDKTDTKAAVSRTYCVTLAVTRNGAAGSDAAASATVEDVQLLAHTALPPHIAISSPTHDSVLLGLEPSNLVLGAAAIATQYAAPAPGSGPSDAASGSHPGLGSAGAPTAAAQGPVAAEAGAVAMEEDVVHIDCQRPGIGAAPGVDDDEECDMDPRTLAEAAARLAKYTSEEEVKALPHQQWADLYKESGPEDVNSDISCDFVVMHGATASRGAGGWQLSCGAHKVLSCDTPGCVAVADDVDACVLTLGWPADAAEPRVIHAATIPALAYVLAGKTQRKHLLIGHPDIATTAGVSAVLVEGAKFYYVYGVVPQGAAHGQQQVVDMGLEAGERVLGARLVAASGAAAGSAGANGPRQGSHVLLLIVTQWRLLVHSLSGVA